MNNDILSMLEQLEEEKKNGNSFDVKKEDNNFISLPDGEYQGVCIAIKQKITEKGLLYTLVYEIGNGTKYYHFINLNNNKMFLFNVKSLVQSIFYISGKNNSYDYDNGRVDALTTPDKFILDVTPLIINKDVNFTLTTNKKGYQQCKVTDTETEYPF